jgi:hypothetical protein
MATIGDSVKLIRSKNAGPFFLTFDLMFDGREKYEAACRSKSLTAAAIAQVYGVPEKTVEVFHYTPAFAIKITFPRKVPSCDIGDTDGHGGQQFSALVDLPL